MVRNYDSSDSEEERHDKFRSERVISGLEKDVSNPRNKFARSRSRDKDRFSSSRNDRRDRRDDFRGPRERSKRLSPEVKRYCLICNHSQGNCRCHYRQDHRDRFSSERKHKSKDTHVERKRSSHERKHDDLSLDSRKPTKRKSLEYDLKDINHKTDHSKKNKHFTIDSVKREVDFTPASDVKTILQDDLITLDTYSGSSSENEAESSQKDLFGPALPPKLDSIVHLKKLSPEVVKKEKKCKKKTVIKDESKHDASKGVDRKVLEEVIEIKHSESETEEPVSTRDYGPKLPEILLVKTSSEERKKRPGKEDRHKKRSREVKSLERRSDGERSTEQLSDGERSAEQLSDRERSAEQLSDRERSAEQLSDDELEARNGRAAYHPSDEPSDHLSDDEIGPAVPGAEPSPAQLALQHRAALLKLHMDNKVSFTGKSVAVLLQEGFRKVAHTLADSIVCHGCLA